MVTNEVQNRIEFDDEAVANLLHDLKRVDAPKDFDHRVRARIAQGRPAENRGSRVPVWVKAGVPAALLLAVGGYIGINSLPTKEQPQVVASEVIPVQPAPSQPGDVTSGPMTAAVPEVASVRTPFAAPGSGRNRPTSRQRNVKAGPVGGSTDSALRTGRTIELTEVPAADALGKAGARVSFNGSSMKVDDASGSAMRSGLRAGDVIESIDGKSVDAKSTLKGSAAGKKLRVLRDGKPVDIVIKN